MRKTKMIEKQRKALAAARKTLAGIDQEKFWKKVIARVAPKVRANERARVLSLRNASSHVVD